MRWLSSESVVGCEAPPVWSITCDPGASEIGQRTCNTARLAGRIKAKSLDACYYKKRVSLGIKGIHDSKFAIQPLPGGGGGGSIEMRPCLICSLKACHFVMCSCQVASPVGLAMKWHDNDSDVDDRLPTRQRLSLNRVDYINDKVTVFTSLMKLIRTCNVTWQSQTQYCCNCQPLRCAYLCTSDAENGQRAQRVPSPRKAVPKSRIPASPKWGWSIWRTTLKQQVAND